MDTPLDLLREQLDFLNERLNKNKERINKLKDPSTRISELHNIALDNCVKNIKRLDHDIEKYQEPLASFALALDALLHVDAFDKSLEKALKVKGIQHESLLGTSDTRDLPKNTMFSSITGLFKSKMLPYSLIDVLDNVQDEIEHDTTAINQVVADIKEAERRYASYVKEPTLEPSVRVEAVDVSELQGTGLADKITNLVHTIERLIKNYDGSHEKYNVVGMVENYPGVYTIKVDNDEYLIEKSQLENTALTITHNNLRVSLDSRDGDAVERDVYLEHRLFDLEEYQPVGQIIMKDNKVSEIYEFNDYPKKANVTSWINVITDDAVERLQVIDTSIRLANLGLDKETNRMHIRQNLNILRDWKSNALKKDLTFGL